MSRRMFSDEITTTDTFLDMPSGSQLLYFHLGMQADDDGFISNPKMVMRVIGSSDDELKLLFVKKFLLAFDSGVCVVKHWRINNQIRKDRYTETKYTKEKSQLFIRENGAYTFNQEDALPLPKGHFIPTINHIGNRAATNGQPSIGKYREVKGSKENKDLSFSIFWNEYPKKIGKGIAERKWKSLKPEEKKLALEVLPQHKNQEQWRKDGGAFIPHPSTWLNQRRWEDELQVEQKFKVDEF